MQHIWPCGGASGELSIDAAPCHTFLESSHWEDVKFWLTCNAATYSFWDIHGQMAIFKAQKTHTLSIFGLALHDP